ncbi:MAG: hypothetical protein ACRD0N_11990 [Acidimicrobiales bacterium]
MKPKLDHRSLRQELARMGQEAVPPPSPGFLAELEGRLRAEPRITVVEPAPVTARRRYQGAWVAVGAAVAAVLALAGPQGGGDVSVTADDAAATSTPTTAVPDPTTTTATTTTTTAAAAPPAPVAAAAPPQAPRPTTTTSAVPRTTTTIAAVVSPDPVQLTTTTTTWPIVRLDLRCGATAGESPKVSCAWSGPEQPGLAGWRMHRAAGKDAKRLVWSTPDAGARSYEDTAVVGGTTYQYLVEAVDAAGRTLAKGGIVEVACCAG